MLPFKVARRGCHLPFAAKKTGLTLYKKTVAEPVLETQFSSSFHDIWISECMITKWYVCVATCPQTHIHTAIKTRLLKNDRITSINNFHSVYVILVAETSSA